MQIINIEIPDNLNEQQEVLMIAKNLSKKLLPASLKSIGDGIEIQELETIIKVNRISTDKITITFECEICSTIYDKESKSKFFVNYGGKIKEKHTCSKNCSEEYMSFLNENRCDFSRLKLQRKQVRDLYYR
ncbi:MAG: hypothetical protein GY849_00705 [Deltaproteobacteria bacterium]|nr:hypothetical protein [Deltaproteobacteria bacterium]